MNVGVHVSNPITNQEKLDLDRYYCISQDRTGNFAVANGPQNISGSHYIANAGQLCSLEWLKDHADGHSILMYRVWIRKTKKGQGSGSHTSNKMIWPECDTCHF